jgi:hypothetical protein
VKETEPDSVRYTRERGPPHYEKPEQRERYGRSNVQIAARGKAIKSKLIAKENISAAQQQHNKALLRNPMTQ